MPRREVAGAPEAGSTSTGAETTSWQPSYRRFLGGSMAAGGEQWFVGVDWATEQHQVCVLEGDGKVVGERQVAHSGDGIADLCMWLEELSGGHLASVHAAIEMPHGAVVEMLLERKAQVYAINPKQLDRFRDRFTAAGAKDDRRDARVLADSLRTDRRSFRHLQVEAPEVIELREWSRMREELKQDRNRLINRLREQLRRYYPQMLELGGDLGAAWFLELWEKAPTPVEAARIRKASIAAILKRNRIRRLDAAGVLHILRQQPLQVSRGTTAAAKAHIESVIVRLRPVTELIDQAHARLDELIAEIVANDDSTEIEEQRDVCILRSMPGIGSDRARHAARRGHTGPGSPRLSHVAHPDRSGAGDPAVGEDPRGDNAACVQQATAGSDVSLGAGGDPARCGESGAVCPATRSWPAPWPRATHRFGAAAEGGVRDAA